MTFLPLRLGLRTSKDGDGDDGDDDDGDDGVGDDGGDDDDDSPCTELHPSSQFFLFLYNSIGTM